MKKFVCLLNNKIFKHAAIMLLLAGSFVSCGNENNDPVETPFTEYSLAGTFCQWTNLNYDDKIIVINSNEKLASYINCLEGNYPEIDFLKYTLLLANGIVPNGCIIKKCLLQQLSINGYKLDIEILTDISEIMCPWVMALIVNKLKEESNIELKIIVKQL